MLYSSGYYFSYETTTIAEVVPEPEDNTMLYTVCIILLVLFLWPTQRQVGPGAFHQILLEIFSNPRSRLELPVRSPPT